MHSPNEAMRRDCGGMLWHATWLHAALLMLIYLWGCRLPQTTIVMRPVFGNNMQILITVYAAFALKIANIYTRYVCVGVWLCISVCVSQTCIVYCMQILCSKHWRWNLRLDYIYRSIDCARLAFHSGESIGNQSIYLLYLLHTHTKGIDRLNLCK